MYSNFESKDDLFLAVIDQRAAERVRDLGARVLNEDTYEQAVRTAARLVWDAARDTPEWIPVLTEFWIHASGRDDVRAATAEQHGRAMDVIADLVQGIADRHGMEYTISARDAARGSSALTRGLELERLLDPRAHEAQLFEEMWTAFMLGIARPAGS